MSSLYYRLDDSPRGRIIQLIQRHGSLDIKELRSALGVSDTAIRQQLRRLQADGLIRASRAPSRGPGRPGQVYELTPEARDLFASYSEDLALNLYAELLADQGPEVVSRLLDRVGARLARQYEGQITGKALQERVHSLSQILDDKGIMSDISRDADVIFLHEYHCPYHELAEVHREICEMERGVMAQVLNADVELTVCMMDGHHSCSFAVRPQMRNA
ncbi:MAG TPA: winged helix-turn-helix transcriptional regulator [Caldilineae bacterium]|nr:winged helix-turn-helix transcriptional regulator [Caldilineae bacterium]